MKYLIILLFLVACSDEPKPKRTISLDSCTKAAEALKGSFAYTPDRFIPCAVFVEEGEYGFYTDDTVSGMRLGLGMAINRPKLKDFYKCINKDKTKDMTTTQAITLDRACRKKLGMVDYY